MLFTICKDAKRMSADTKSIFTQFKHLILAKKPFSQVIKCSICFNLCFYVLAQAKVYATVK